MSQALANRIAIVTGASSGLGDQRGYITGQTLVE